MYAHLLIHSCPQIGPPPLLLAAEAWGQGQLQARAGPGPSSSARAGGEDLNLPGKAPSSRWVVGQGPSIICT